MINHKNPFMNTAMNVGAILGFALVAYSTVLWVLNLSTSQVAGYISYVIIIAGLFFGTQYYRDKQLGGEISYKLSLRFGVVIAFFASIIIAFFTYILFQFIDPSLMDQIATLQEEVLLKEGFSEDQVAMQMEAAKKIMSPGFMAFSSILGYTLFGFIISLITSIFVKRESMNPFDKAMSEIKDDNN
jgi:hypothetical protein